MKLFTFAMLLFVAADDSSILNKLSRKLKETRSVSASFVQTQNIKEFAQPVVSQGNFFFSADGKLKWVTSSPYKNVMLIKDSQVTLYYPDMDHTETRRLGDDPVSKAVAASMAAFFSGDINAIKERYKVVVKKDGGGLIVLCLTPSSMFEARVTRQILLSFEGDHIKQMKIIGKDEGITSIEFSNVQVNPPLPPNTFEIK